MPEDGRPLCHPVSRRAELSEAAGPEPRASARKVPDSDLPWLDDAEVILPVLSQSEYSDHLASEFSRLRERNTKKNYAVARVCAALKNEFAEVLVEGEKNSPLALRPLENIPIRCEEAHAGQGCSSSTPENALVLRRFFREEETRANVVLFQSRTGPEIWMNLQTMYDLATAHEDWKRSGRKFKALPQSDATP